MKKKIEINPIKLLLFLYGFFLIYMPDFSFYINLNGLVIYLILTVVFFIRNINSKRLTEILKSNIFVTFVALNVLFTLYYFIRTLIAGTDLYDFRSLRIVQNMLPILLCLGCILIYIELEKFNYSKEKKYKFIIDLALFQSIIAISMIFFPSLKNVALNMFYKGNNDYNIYISNWRLYGFCDGNYTYSFQIMSSLLAVFTFNYAIKYKEKKYFLASLMIFSTSFLNGRTGILIYLICVLYLIIMDLLIKGKIISFIKISLICTFSLYILYYLILKYLPGTLSLLNHAFYDIIAFFNGDKTSTETGYLLNMINLPRGFLNYIFGAGYRIYGHAGINYGYELSSDIGFINDLFMTGVFSVLFLYNSVFIFIKKIKMNSKKNIFENSMCNLIIMYFIIANTKGEFFRSQIMISSVLLILIFMFMEVYKNEKNFYNYSDV